MLETKVEELNVDERRNKIIELINKESKVKVINLSKLFGISEVTIRNDLSELENAGVLERIRGGAISTSKAYYNMSLHERLKENEQEKKIIAVEAASMVSDGDTVIINSGTTTLLTSLELKSVKNLTIVTNSLSIAREVGHYKNFHVILLGGSLNPQYQFTYGDDTISQLKRYRADKLILSADGVSVDEGITTYHHLEAEVNRQMIVRANKTIVVADYSKIGRESFMHIESLDSVDVLITNQNANQQEIQSIREKGIEIRLV
jgi:DeoR family fructose operon transcriptional repressor